jgi:hypothetical protein
VSRFEIVAIWNVLRLVVLFACITPCTAINPVHYELNLTDFTAITELWVTFPENSDRELFWTDLLESVSLGSKLAKLLFYCEGPREVSCSLLTMFLCWPYFARK